MGAIAVFSVITPFFFFEALHEKADIKTPEDKKKHLIIGVLDRGLCGAIHSVAKQMKARRQPLAAAGKEVKIIGVGDKIRSILHR